MNLTDRPPHLIVDGKQILKRYSTRAHSFELAPLDLALYAGEITAVVGENGDGKTTLLSLVGGRLVLTSGDIHYPYFERLGKTTAYTRQQGIAMLTQELPPWPGKLADNLHFYASIRGVKGRENQAWVDFILNRLDIEKYREATWAQISGGFRTRFSLARALIQKPNLLILDEPLANLDVNTQLRFLDDLRDLVKTLDQPITMLLSSQHLHEIESISDKVIFLRDGRTLYNGPMADFGSDRIENAFELACDRAADEVTGLFTGGELLGIRSVGDHFLLRFPRSVEGEDVLRTLLAAGVRIKLFRNISQSTRKLFQAEE